MGNRWYVNQTGIYGRAYIRKDITMRYSMNTPYSVTVLTFSMVDSLFRAFRCVTDPNFCETEWPGTNPDDPDIGYSCHFVENRD